MMTRNSSCSRIVTVWLVLLAFLCGMIVPSLALANQDMTIDTEGDPTDGFGAAGGGGGSLIDDGDQSSVNPDGSLGILVFVDIVFHWQMGQWTPIFIINDQLNLAGNEYPERSPFSLYLGAKK